MPDNVPLSGLAQNENASASPSTPNPSSSFNNNQVQWEGPEHTYLGNHVTLHFDHEAGPASTLKLHLDNGLQLTYGQVIALGGDFYGAKDCQPISDDPSPPRRFVEAYESLAARKKSCEEAQKILEIMQVEIDLVNKALKDGLQPSSVYEQLGDTLSGKYNVATGGGTRVNEFVPRGRYLLLASDNWDHFGQRAIQCYSYGHGVAMAAAVAAKHIQDPTLRTTMLQRAYAMNAFADHFLTDIFSAGHMRTPRKELSRVVTPSALGALLSRCMHDEDCAYGLDVQNAAGIKWRAYGDKRLFDSIDKVNLQIVKQATQLSADEIWAAYQIGVPAKDYAALLLVPNLNLLADYKSSSNPAPLFIPMDGTVGMRTNIEDPESRNWTKNWRGITALYKLRHSRRFDHLGDRHLSEFLSAGLLQVALDPAAPPHGRPALVIVQSTGRKTDAPEGNPFEPIWWAPFCIEDPLSGAFCVTTDLTGTGQNQLLVLTPAGNVFGFDPFASRVGYQQTWSSKQHRMSKVRQLLILNRHGNEHRQVILFWVDPANNISMAVFATTNGAANLKVEWEAAIGPNPVDNIFLAVERRDTAASNIVQFSTDHGYQRLTTFAPDTTGSGFVFAWSMPDIGPKYSSAVLAVDALGTGPNCILQMAHDNNIFSMTLFTPTADNVSYVNSWSDSGMGSGTFINWFPVLTGFDDIERVLVIYHNDGLIGMRLYQPLARGPGYFLSWDNSNMGTFDAEAQWLTMDTGPSAESTIAQTTRGKLVTYVYDRSSGGYVVRFDRSIQVSASYVNIASLNYHTPATITD